MNDSVATPIPPTPTRKKIEAARQMLLHQHRLVQGVAQTTPTKTGTGVEIHESDVVKIAYDELRAEGLLPAAETVQ